MTTAPKLTLYDLASANNTPFSPYTWQIRLALNYKGLPFKTVWLNFVDIKPALEKLGGVIPTYSPAEPNGVYTVPVLKDDSFPGPPRVISHTLKIAEYLDEAYPERRIFPEGTKALLELYIVHIRERISKPILAPLLIPCTLPHLAECDHAYFRETRERWLQTKLEELCPPAKRQELLKRLEEELENLGKILDKNGGGSTFIFGEQISRGDFALIGTFAWFSELDPDTWEKVKTWNDGRWERLWSASEQWRQHRK